jgi:hypothetical protein
MMSLNLIPFIVLWGLLAASVIGMIVWRKTVSSNEDDSLHMMQGVAAEQLTVARKLDVIDNRDHGDFRPDPRIAVRLSELGDGIQHPDRTLIL